MTRPTRFPTALALFALSAGCALEAEGVPKKSLTKPPEAEAPATAPAVPLREMMSIADVSERAVRSVVNVSVEKRAPARARRGPPHPLERFFGRPPGPAPRGQPQRGAGSGVIVRSDGLVLTNNHVIDGADEVTVTLHDERSYEAEVIGADPPTDLAVLRLKDPPKALEPMAFGDSDALRLGEVVVAIGNPFGVGQTVTMGIVSAKGRANMGIVDYEDFIQTDAAINPGNSGGALVNLKGELVGINAAILSRTGGNQGIGFAIPTRMAKRIMDSLLEDGKVTRGWLGVMIQDLTPEIADAMGLDATRGAVVSEVVPDSPAARAGLEAGDVIVGVDDAAVDSSARLRNLVAASGAAETVELRVLRDGEARTLEVELGEKDADGPMGRAAPGADLGGLEVEPLTDDLRARLRLPSRVEGVVVREVEPGSAAAQASLRPGDVIVGAGRARVRAPEDLAEAYRAADDTLLLRVFRRGGASFVVLKKAP